MQLRLQKDTIRLAYHPGKEMFLADTLSRAYLRNNDQTGTLEEEIIHLARFLPVIKDRLQELRQETQADKTLVKLTKVILSGCSEISACVSAPLQPYFNIRDELTVQDGIVFKGERILIPETMRMDMLRRIHSSHIGVEGSLRRARENLFWLGMTKDVKDFVTKCDTCRSFDGKQRKETLVSHDVPTRPWAKVASDLFSYNSKEYLVTVDYFSNFWEVDYLRSTMSKTVIQTLKALFARYGIPDTLVSDNGPQFASTEFQQFAREWEFCHVNSSPKYPQRNGYQPSSAFDESTHKDTFAYKRDPPSSGSLSTESQEKQLTHLKRRQALYYNRGARDLRPLDIGEKTYRRNRRDLRPSQHADTDAHIYEDIDEKPVQEQPIKDTLTGQTSVNPPSRPTSASQSDSAPPLTTRSGRVVKEPSRFKDYVN
ncbi:uncharacterized protein K02A2.6-like [Saccostrea echinata]|uniref:uncharacterized protein K02A2.6-like n=1 Tax=Saccostrea echinata TaxID=191078 RepID=UPI002A801B1F|nr:uncharacterized protein K02A2.6-like [Saccostrea echinata]